VRDFLFVRGDDPAEGSRSDLTVRQMLAEARAYPDAEFSLGVTVRCGAAAPSWKNEADFWLVQASYDVDRLAAWRRTVNYSGQIFAGVLVMASAKMASRIAADIPEIDVPAELVNAFEHDTDAGVKAALELVTAIRRSGAFDGVHLVPVGRFQQVAILLRELHPSSS
jgi:5,10-methylenetetrahydrofolate reductase